MRRAVILAVAVAALWSIAPARPQNARPQQALALAQQAQRALAAAQSAVTTMQTAAQQASAKADAASAAAASAQTSANTATAAIPPICIAKPAADTTTGSAGTGTPCTPRIDGSRQTQVMPATAVTLGDGTFSGGWPGTFTSAPTTAIASAKTTSDPYTCQFGTVTTTNFAGKCWRQVQSITLPTVATSLLGLTLPTAPAAPAGITIMIVGRQ